MTRTLTTALIVILSAGAAFAAEPRVLLMGGGHTASALEALGVPFEQSSWPDYKARRVNLFDYTVIISAMDADRAPIAGSEEKLLRFVESGGVFLGMRDRSGDGWVPVPAKKDRSYEFGEILAPEHPIFREPNALTREVLAGVHGGSIYDAWYALGEGWVPLISTGKQQGWDQQPAADPGAHYGLIELEHGAGRIILTQMIPEYHWFNDGAGPEGAGAQFFGNLVAYALSHSPDWPEGASAVPECYRRSVSELLPEPTAGGAWPLDTEGWSFESQGQFTGKPDRRAVFTISHPHTPTEAGAFGRVSRTVAVPAEGGCYLRFYVSDDYCGGLDLEMEGDRRVGSFENRKADMRFCEVLVDGEQVWELDVLGMNPRPADRRFYLVDISDAVRGKDEVTVSLQVRDRQATDQPFATDVFWAGVEIFPGIARIPARQMEAEGFEQANGAMEIAGDRGSLSRRFTGENGSYYAAIALRDDHTGQSRLRLSVAGRQTGEVQMTADDYGDWRAVFGPVQVARGDEIRLDATRDGQEAIRVEEIALLPRELVERQPVREEVAIQPPCYQPGEEPARDSFTVSVTDHAGVARSGEIATQGLPFAYGTLKSAQNLRVLDPGGNEVPVQARALNYWPDGSAMFALVSFPASVEADASAQYTVEFGSQVRPAEFLNRQMTVTERDGAIVVNTGPLQATLSTTRGTLVESAVLDGMEMVGERPWAALVTGEDGTEYSSALGEVTKTQVVEAGPLRAVIRRIGRHTAEDGSTLLEFDMIQEFYAGSPTTRLSYVFTHKEDMPTEKLREVRLNMTYPWADEGARATVWGEDGPISGQAAGCVQLELDRALVGDAAAPVEQGRTQGFARMSAEGGRGPSLAVATRWWWERWPKAVEMSDGRIALDLIPYDSHTQFSDGPFVLYQGEGITHEVMLGFEAPGADPDSAEVFEAFRDRLVASADPQYAVGTLALGEMPAEDPTLFPRYEEGVDRMHDGYLAKRETRREYGMENFGDDTFEWGYGPSYTFWSNQEYDHHHGFLVEWFRSGDRRFFEIGEQGARHYEATDCYHWAPGREQLIGAPHHHNSKHLVEEGWYPDHCIAGASNGHSWVEGLLDYWLLTGDVRAEETARAMGDWYVWSVENDAYGAGGQERGPGWTLIALSSLYRLTGDERYRDAGNAILDWMETIQDPVRGVISVPISEQPSYEGGTAFMHGIVGRGLGRFYEATGEERAMRMCLGIGEWLTTEPMGPPARFWYKQAPSCKTGYSATDQCTAALSYPYRYTGDEWFGELTEVLLGAVGPNVRSMTWLYSSQAHLQSRITPLEVTLPHGNAVCCAEEPWSGQVQLRNTTGEPVEATLSGEAQGLRITCEPATLTIAPGETATATVSACPEASTPACTADSLLRVECGDRTQTRSFQVRVVPALVREERDTRAATLAEPFALGEADGMRFIHVPREVRFNTGPWAAADDAGSATWTLTIPAAGEYTLLGHCWWLDEKGNSFYAQVDGGEPVEFGNDSRMGLWQWIEGPTLSLGAGEHTVRILAREDGARIERVMLTNAVGGE